MIQRFKSFFFENFITENRIEFLKNRHPSFDTSHDERAQYRNASDIIDHFATHADPSPNKAHTQWIVNQYKKQLIRQEDAPRIKSILSNFNQHKGKLQKPDLNQYKSLSDVEDAITPHVGSTSGKERKRSVKSEGAELIHDGPNLTVHHLKTKEAACMYGAHTRWCTAAKEDNKFDDYNEDGPLYVIQNKHTGEKHQFHFETHHFKDATDGRIDLPKFIEKNPELKQVKQFRDSSHGIYFARDQKEFDRLMPRAFNSPNSNIRVNAIRSPYATHEHLSKALSDQDTYVRREAARHPNASSEHISKALDDEAHPVRTAAASNSNATHEHLTKALNDKSRYTRAAVASNPNATHEHLTKALNDKMTEVRTAAAGNPSATHEHLAKALKDVDKNVRETAVHHPRISDSNLRSALNDKDKNIRSFANTYLRRRGIDV